MVNYARYAQLCPIIYGRGTATLLGEEVKKLGCTKVMVVSGKHVAKSEIYEKCKKSLLDAGIKLVEFNEVIPEPPDYIVNRGGEVARAEKVDGIVAIGGGSAMDAAKAINILINNPPPINQYFGNPFYKPGVPVVMVVTTAGTGSESTNVAVITDTVNNVKNSVLGAASLGILDPEATITVPPEATVHTGMDAFAHAAEAITAKVPNPKSELLASDAIRRIMKYLPVAVKDGANIEARGNLLLASNFAGIAFNDALVHLGHAIAHSIGAKFHVTHGVACALALPEVMKYAAGIDASKVKVVGEAMGISFTGSESDEEIGEIVAEAIRKFIRELKVKSIRQLGISKEDLIDTVDMIFKDPCYNFVPRELNKQEVVDILNNMYENY
ncbi:iron-containing alcohol dehydrogenase [Thermosediminibacter oceani]|uniref:Iron-containing alcohol dehydrogenase n=1 Tax=Thermosediminibacter oceani (strain ATCC BAA-1034 / DSM 16646 / JW/IW-1228P) TaxID=555079 RepID=D9RY68_THEOJ|nr:iron-containing alcohol dehydrogenase [Thermosediminibacter oceani]ADL08292.1 iron-containing alcohol dehydrogenase [Thermosediminibacter oceani DSM 16646]